MQQKTLARFMLFSLTFVVAGLACLAMMVGLAGCPQPAATSTTPSPQRFPGVTLNIACPADIPEKLIEAYAGRWTSPTGAKIQMVRYQPGQPVPDTADILVCLASEMPTFAAADQLQPLPPALRTAESYDWRRVLPVYQNKLLEWDRLAYAVPLLGEAPLCFYRSDLLAEAAKKLDRNLPPPTTWEEYLAIAQLFAGQPQLGWDGQTLPPLPRDDAELEREFFSIAAPFARRTLKDSDATPPESEMFSFHFDLATMEPRIARPAFVHALKSMQQMQKHRPEGDADRPAEAFANGQAVLCLADARWIEVFRKSQVAGKFGFCRVPGAGQVFPFGAEPNYVSYLGTTSWLASVTKSSPRAEAAFDFLVALTSPDTSKQIVCDPVWGGGATRRDQFDSSGGWNGFGLPPPKTRELVMTLEQTLLHPGVKNPVVTLRIPGRREYQQLLLAEVREALQKDKEAGAALTATKEAWQRLLDKADKNTSRRNYYLSLSLKPPG